MAESFIGLAALSNMLLNRGEYQQRTHKIFKMIKTYKTAIELHNWHAMENLAQYYEKNKYSHNFIVKFYEMSILAGGCSYTMYNFADYYRTIRDYTNMEKYYIMAIEEYSDIESMYIMALHHQTLGNMKIMTMYYLLAISQDIEYEFPDKHLFNPFTILDILEPISPEMRNTNIDFHMQLLLNTNTQIIAFKNKIILFTRLNNILECGICYEERLNIDLFCGHCVCIECYKKVYNKPCPFCRITFSNLSGPIV
jgi:hypothetical protein